jgi:methionyl aminopeptidase
MKKLSIKTPEEIKIMTRGGRILGQIRDTLAKHAREGITTLEIDSLADKLIAKAGGQPSFKLVEGYSHATCISVNEEVVHGLPGKYVLKKGDVVSIDVGIVFEGFHTDTSVTVVVGRADKEVQKFLEVGRKCLDRAIKQAKPGKRIADISAQMQRVEEAGFAPVQALTGHGIGRSLHEEPAIPCFVVGEYHHSPLIKEGMVLAIEIMYNVGTADVVYKNNDGWTIATADGKISGLFEETVAVTSRGPVILTKSING